MGRVACLFGLHRMTYRWATGFFFCEREGCEFVGI